MTPQCSCSGRPRHTVCTSESQILTVVANARIPRVKLCKGDTIFSIDSGTRITGDNSVSLRTRRCLSRRLGCSGSWCCCLGNTVGTTNCQILTVIANAGIPFIELCKRDTEFRLNSSAWITWNHSIAFRACRCWYSRCGGSWWWTRSGGSRCRGSGDAVRVSNCQVLTVWSDTGIPRIKLCERDSISSLYCRAWITSYNCVSFRTTWDWNRCWSCALCCAWYSGCYIYCRVVTTVDRESPVAVISVIPIATVEILAWRPRPIDAVVVANIEAWAIDRVEIVPLGEFDEREVAKCLGNTSAVIRFCCSVPCCAVGNCTIGLRWRESRPREDDRVRLIVLSLNAIVIPNHKFRAVVGYCWIPGDELGHVEAEK